MDSLKPYHQPIIETKLSDPRAAPIRAYQSDAGADLMSTQEFMLYPGYMKMLDTGVSVKIPVGFVGLVFNRSSQGKIEVQLANGTGIIDSAYRGNIKVLLKNNGENAYFIRAFETRIAQLIITPVVLARFVPTTDEANWEDTDRGTGGFGSTGV